MNQFISNETVKEIKGLQNVMFLLENRNGFSLTQYKVMQNNPDQGLIKCAKSIYNGKLKLVYFNENFKPLSSFIELISLEKLLLFFEDILEHIVALKSNGFLALNNIVFSADRIFVNYETSETGLIYLPIDDETGDTAEFEKKIIVEISEIITAASKASMHITNRFCTEMIIECKSVEDAYNFIRKNRERFEDAYVEKSVQIEKTISAMPSVVLETSEKLVLKSQDTVEPIEFVIDKDDFVIGKKQNSVDGYISSNAAVSRQHCIITRTDNGFELMDLGSVNGTFINGIKVAVSESQEIKDGDVLRIANLTFNVYVR